MNTKIRLHTRPARSARTLAALSTLAVQPGLVLLATADKLVDSQCLAALHRRGLCCPCRPDKPPCFEPPIIAIDTVKLIGQAKTQTPPHNEFQLLDRLMNEGGPDRGVHRLMPFSRARSSSSQCITARDRRR